MVFLPYEPPGEMVGCYVYLTASVTNPVIAYAVLSLGSLNLLLVLPIVHFATYLALLGVLSISVYCSPSFEIDSSAASLGR